MSIQSLINAATAGSTLILTDGVYRETFVVNKPLTLQAQTPHGVIIDGRDVDGQAPVRQTWMSVTANDVTVRGIDFRYAAGVNATGSIEAVSVARFLLDNCEVSYSYVNINISSTTDSELRDVHSHHGGNLDVRVSALNSANRGLRNIITRGRFTDANWYDGGVVGDQGAIKVTLQDLFVCNGAEVDHNNSNGLWLDALCHDAHLVNNRCHDNNGPGIMDETSSRTIIHDNVSWRNAPTPEWGFNAGILISSSQAAEVYANLCAWNGHGISVISQNRPDNPGVTGNYVHDNLVCSAQPVAGTDHWGLFWGQDWAGTMYDVASNNHGLNNRFYYADAAGAPIAENQYARFIWDGYRDMASFQTVPGGTGSTYVSQATAQAALIAAGVPLTPTGDVHSGGITATGHGTATLARKGAHKAAVVGTGHGTATINARHSHADSVVATGHGTAVLVGKGGRRGSAVTTGHGTAAVGDKGAHRGSLTATGHGTATVSGKTTGRGAVNATGHGAAVLSARGAHRGSLIGSGHGLAVLGVAGDHRGSIVATGGGAGALSWIAYQPTADAKSGVCRATGSGEATLETTSTRFTSLGATAAGSAVLVDGTSIRGESIAATGHGTATIGQTTARYGAVTATGHGRATLRQRKLRGAHGKVRKVNFGASVDAIGPGGSIVATGPSGSIGERTVYGEVA